VPALAVLVEAFLDELFTQQPEWATAAGDHRFDGRWSDTSERGRQDRLALVDRWAATFTALDPDSLDAEERIDRDLLLGELAALRFAETELREEAWSPLAWVYYLGFNLFPLTARDYAPLATRLRSMASRLEGVRGVLEDARLEIGTHPTRLVARLHAETAAARVAGIAGIGREAVVLAEDAAASDPDVAALLPRLRGAAETAADAIAAFEAHLREVVLPAATGSELLGRELFARKLAHTLRDPEATPEGILARAEAEFAAVRAEMVRLARDLWPQWCSGEPEPAEDGALVRGVLDAIAREHPAPDAMVQACRDELERIEAFCRERGVIGLAEEPLEIRWTPEFLRSYAGAMLDSPGPLDIGQKSFFSITPVREEWDADAVESYMREMNARQLQVLTIHEAVPGHYLQMAYANRGGTLARRVFRSGLFAEGWAVYVTQVMLDRGYAGDDDALWLVHWKFYLRAVTNAILDVRIHCNGMTTEEAVALMVDGAFQEESEARAKDERARLSSTQLSTYFLGSLGMWDLEHEARRRAAAAGASPDSVPAPRVVGGYPETPGFDGRAHLEAVISHGAPPIPLLRRIMFGEA